MLAAVPFSEHAVDADFNGATSVYSEDVDGDGDLDILGAAFDADAITWWENTAGDGSVWSEHTVDGDFDGAHCVYSADVDGDGDMDVLGAAHWAGITWWENTTRDGSTWTEHNVDADSIGAASVYSADIDGDGDLDILGAAQMDDDVAWWENTTGDGTVWTEHSVDGDFDGAHSVYSADIDGDGDLDVLGAAVYGDDITWWENSVGDGTAWIEHTIDGDFSGAISVYSADVDGDGDLDVLGAASEADDITWWENVARDGSVWTEHTIEGSFEVATSVYAADVDSDGDLDVLGTAAYGLDDVTWWENTSGDGSVWTKHTVDAVFAGAYAVHSADLDGDGDLDVLGAARSADQITWWENKTIHASTFFTIDFEHTVSGDFSGAYSVHSADVDDDGDMDILGAAYLSGPVWWENETGDGSIWTEHTVDGSFYGASSVYSADIDGDGDLDVLGAARFDDAIAWWENSLGDGSVWIEHTVDGDFDGASAVYSADVDGDGDADVLGAAFRDNDIAWWENTAGDGSDWVEHRVDEWFLGASSVYSADVDGDGDLDILGAAYDSGVMWWENETGDGSVWIRRGLDRSFHAATSIYSADMDGDGDRDILGAAEYGGINWWENTAGDGSVWIERNVAQGLRGARSVKAADVDGDGDLDVLGAIASSSGHVRWWENTGGDGSVWTERAVAEGSDGAISVDSADMDGDGDLDVLGAGWNTKGVTWWENRLEDGSDWTEHTLGGLFWGARSVHSADVDGDGDMDALGAAYWDGIRWWENWSGDGGVWIEHTIDGNFRWARSVYSADVDGDGDVDVLGAAFLDREITWWENAAGDGSDWIEHILDGDFAQASGVYSADMDGDGDMDILGAAELDGKIMWWENTMGDGSVWIRHTVVRRSFGATEAEGVYSVDLDGDGDMDVLGAFLGREIAWWENAAGDGSDWKWHIVDDDFSQASSVYSADMDGDGDMDILGGGAASGVAWWENRLGDGREWTAHTIDANFAGTRSVHSADFDSDGDMDAVGAASRANDVVWWENTAGDGTVWTEHTVDRHFDEASSVYSADMDGDGDLDILGAAFDADDITWWENRGGQFALVTTDAAPATINDGQADDVLRIVAVHRGRIGDSDLELVAFDLLFEESAGDPLTTAEANNLIANLMIYVDADGNETFDVDHDTLVTTVDSLSLNAGVQTVSFADGDPNVQVQVGAPRTYFVVTELTGDASSQSPNQFRIVHRTEAGSMAEDRVYDIELTMEWAADTASSIVTASPVEVQFSQTTFRANEDGTPSGSLVTLTRNATSGTSQVQIGFGNTGTAIAGTDFDDAPIDVTFDSSDDTATVTIPIARDSIAELDETIGLEVTAISGAVIGTQNTATLTIVDDDAATISIDDVAQDEGKAGTTQFAFTVTLDAEVDTPVLVDFATADGSAEDQNLDGDYYSAAGTLSFAGQAGEQQTITVNVAGDDVLEPNEDFFVNLTGIAAGGRNVTFADNQGRGRILRDESLRNALTIATAEIASTGQIDEYTLDLTKGPANGVYSIQVLDYRGDGLDPDVAEVLDANGDPIPVRQRVADATADGASASALVVQLAPGQYRIRVRGQNDTTGRYRLDVRLPGVVNEDGIVRERDVQQAEVCMLQQQFGFNAIAQELFGHKLGFDLTRDQFRPEFDANLSGGIDPVDLEAIISNHGDGVPVQAQATLTRVVTPPAINVPGEPEAEISLSGSTVAVYQNPNLAADVNADGQVTSLDVLLVINRVNADNAESADATIGQGDTPSGEGEMGLGISPPFYDVNGDRVVSPLDVLLVINALNAADSNAHPAAAEGQATSTILVTRLGLVTHLPRVSASQEPARQSVRRREPGNEGKGREVFEVHRSFTSESPKLRTTASSEPFELDADLIDLLAEDVDAAQDQLAFVA